jgi:hypothetical protein
MLEDLIATVAARHSFRSSDFTAVWDGGEFDASRDSHELVIKTGDARRTAVQIGQEPLRDPWKHGGKIAEAGQGEAGLRRDDEDDQDRHCRVAGGICGNLVDVIDYGGARSPHPNLPRKRGKEQVLPQMSNCYCHLGRAGGLPCGLVDCNG